MTLAEPSLQSRLQAPFEDLLRERGYDARTIAGLKWEWRLSCDLRRYLDPAVNGLWVAFLKRNGVDFGP